MLSGRAQRQPAESAGATALLSLLAGLLAVGPVQPVEAHDTGFGHSRRTLFVAAEMGKLALEYRIVASPDEALIEMTAADSDGDGQISAAEKDEHFSAVGRRLAERFKIRTAKGQPLQADFQGFILNNGITQTYRFEIVTDGPEVSFEDNNFPYKPGQVRVVAGAGLEAKLDGDIDISHADWVRLTISWPTPPIRATGR
jgi:hypothetical protein